MKYDGLVIISDLDGTLLDGNRQLNPANEAAIKDFIKNGGAFGVATGRMERTTQLNFPHMPVNIPSIFYNGALIFDLNKQQSIRKNVMNPGLEGFLQGFLDRYPDMGLEINVNGTAYILRSNTIIETQLQREGLVGVPATWDQIPKGWYKVLLSADNARLQEIKSELDKARRPDITIVFSEKELVDIMAQGVSKGSALRVLKTEFGSSWRKIIAIGDNENDLDMLKDADIGVAVGNACTSVKDCADYIIETHASPCIPQVLRLIETKDL